MKKDKKKKIEQLILDAKAELVLSNSNIVFGGLCERLNTPRLLRKI